MRRVDEPRPIPPLAPVAPTRRLPRPGEDDHKPEGEALRRRRDEPVAGDEPGTASKGDQVDEFA